MSPVAINGSNGVDHRLPVSINRKAQAFEPATPAVSDIDPSKLTIKLCEKLTPIPAPETLVFGAIHTDHMLLLNFEPKAGWSAPSIQPYGPLSIDPMSSCIQYSTNLFEGMKAYMGPDGEPRLFRPDMNMKRMKRSADRLALPPFDTNAFLELIKRLVVLEKRWIPTAPGCSLYIRPTYFGTRAGFGVAASTTSTLLVILSPSGPYFPGPVRPISLFAEADTVRAWPGGTGEFKLALNYAPTLRPTREAAQRGYDQILWLFGEDRHLGEVGQMNVFVVLQREDGDLDVITPPLDGTILPGVTRASMLELAARHSAQSPLPGLSPSIKLHPAERHMPLAELIEHHASGTLKELFGVGTAAVLCPIQRVGYDESEIKLAVPEGAFGPVAKGLRTEIMAIQEGKRDHEWSVLCEQ